MNATALIVARPEPLREGLHALVGTMPHMGPVEVASDVQLALGASLAPCPALVLLDADSMGDNVWMTVRRTKAKWPGARTIVLTGNDQQQQEAESAGADVVLPNGFPAGRLVAAILKLLPHPAV